MSSKHQHLQILDVESCRLPRQVEEILRDLDQTRRNQMDIRVLDLGCGRGAHVFKLRQSGYSAYGIDVDSKVISNGEKLFNDYGFNHAGIIKLVHPGSVWPFEDHFFDLVFSDQVLEHVADLDGVLAEVSRVTKIGGISFHRFPAQHILVEPHVFVPFVHWLPKISSFRAFWISLFYRRLPFWHGQDGMSRMQRIRQFVEYLDQKTYYRRLGSVLGLFDKVGFLATAIRPCTSSDSNALTFIKRRIKSAYYSAFISAEVLAVRR
jgi:ubiquinone/menaquinone biosynthesis C-methylase UbiE